jgi:hypothetical protein
LKFNQKTSYMRTVQANSRAFLARSFRSGLG